MIHADIEFYSPDGTVTGDRREEVQFEALPRIGETIRISGVGLFTVSNVEWFTAEDRGLPHAPRLWVHGTTPKELSERT